MEIFLNGIVLKLDFKNEKETREDIFSKDNKQFIGLRIKIFDSNPKNAKPLFSFGNTNLYDFFGIPLVVLNSSVNYNKLDYLIDRFLNHLLTKGEGIVIIFPNFSVPLKVMFYQKIKNKLKEKNYKLFIIPTEFKEQLSAIFD
jgi:hypothetical protein